MYQSDLIDEYILEHIDNEPPLLKKIYRDAHVKLLHGSMSSGHLQGRLLKMIVRMIKPKQILEIGTYVGYSAISMAEGLVAGGKLHTIEIDDELETIIRKNIHDSGFQQSIELHIGDALDVIPTFADESFDLVFIDGNKRTYWGTYEALLPKVSKGGFILADNTLWHGKVLDEPASNDWQTKGIIEFNSKLKSDDRVEKIILPIRDGLTLIQKK
ncbi:MAG: O-methyltransferase [Fermentimonas sp.]|jgi:caffeoyl-CoA O-methyltransferase